MQHRSGSNAPTACSCPPWCDRAHETTPDPLSGAWFHSTSLDMIVVDVDAEFLEVTVEQIVDASGDWLPPDIMVRSKEIEGPVGNAESARALAQMLDAAADKLDAINQL